MSLVYFGTNTPEWWENYFTSGDWASKGGSQQTIDHMQHVLNVLDKEGIDLTDKMVLDVGCALGEGTQLLHKAGADAMGTDFSVSAIAQARRRYPHLGFFESDIRNIKGSYDIIIANHILEHMGSDVVSIVASLNELCDTLVISVPAIRNYNLNHKGVHTGQVKTATDRYPPRIRSERVCIW